MKDQKKEIEKERLLKRLKNTESKNEEQLKAIKDQREQQFDALEKNNQFKDYEIKNIVLLKDGLKELAESYPDSFSNTAINDLKKLATIEKRY